MKVKEKLKGIINSIKNRNVDIGYKPNPRNEFEKINEDNRRRLEKKLRKMRE